MASDRCMAWVGCALLAAAAPVAGDLPPAGDLYEITSDGTVFIDAESALVRTFGRPLERLGQEAISDTIRRLAESLPAGGALDLPRSVPCGELDFRRVADGVQITRGHGGRVILGPGQRGIQLVLAALDQLIAASPANDEPPSRRVAMFDDEIAPASDLVALFCKGKIDIRSDVRNCAWIAGANAFGRRTVTAEARVDDCLFLCFGINWPFQDYNAHWDPANAGQDWLKNAQLWFDCKGGGTGTRLYLMVETNYGNPGPGVVLIDCEGMSLYNGTTERASSRGPGTYWLKDCRGVQIGLRGINAFCPPGPKGPEPAHDITIEGGDGNVLHAMRLWGHASGATAVNSDPNLQVWMAAFEFETEGFDRPGVLRYCFTPKHQAPPPETVAEVRPEARRRAETILREWRKQQRTPRRIAEVARQILAGRTLQAPYNATHEQTFVYAGVDLTEGPEDLPGGRTLPAPPSVPPTDAPRLRRPLAFTQAAGFGKALLDAGADPTGRRRSDDAFARVLFDMPAAGVAGILEDMRRAGDAYEAARARDDKPAAAEAVRKARAFGEKLWPVNPEAKGKRDRRPLRPPLEIPAGRFRLTMPLLIWNTRQVMGAGPERTVLEADGNFPAIRLATFGTFGNFAVEGGRVGIAVTGPDHNSRLPAPLKSYVRGSDFYNITFRGQSFAGVHLGNEDVDVMGGAEFDQNRFVDLSFLNTGKYGIYDNGHMIDKWLCLHNRFEGQSVAGIALKFTCVIKGGVYGCTFRNIDGPGIDIMGGAPQYAFRPGIVTVDQCEFIECGRADAPAVDLGYAELAMLTHSRITTRGKAVQTGLIGSPQIVEDMAVDVRTAGGGPAVTLRAVRNAATARANGHCLRDVTANGPVAFVNDANEHNELFEPTRIRRGIGEGKDIDWDTNTAVTTWPPPNGWVHPFVLYNCRFGAKRYAYSLLNVDTAAGKVLEEVDLAPLAK